MKQEIDIMNIEKDAVQGLKKSLVKIRKVKKRTKIIIGIILVIILIIIGFAVFKKEESPYEWVEVFRGDIVEEVSATGTVKSADDINLRFETSGTVEKVYVFEGQEVKRGAFLVKLYTGKLYSQFLQAQAGYNQARAELDQFMAGATDEGVRVAEQVVENAKVSLEDVKAKAENDSNEKYDDALVYLSNSSSNANITLADLSNFEVTYFNSSDTLSTTYREKEGRARDSFFGTSTTPGAQDIVDETILNPVHENIDNALVKMRVAVDKIKDTLDFAREAMSSPIKREDVSSTDQASLDSDIASMNTALTNLSTAQQAIASQIITNQTNINSAENTLKKAEDDFDEVKAGPREIDVAIYRAKVDKARASMVELQQKLDDAVLKSPINGVIAKVNVKIGEVVTAGGDIVVSLISPNKFQIEVDISEADIGKVELSNATEIILDAFPEETWAGQIAEMEPAETIVDGVVYYRITVVFDRIDERVRSGMSADITIKTDERSNVLYIPYRAIVYKNGNRFVRVIDGESYKEIEVETGLRGSKGEIEIISGLEEGQNIITFIKK